MKRQECLLPSLPARKLSLSEKTRIISISLLLGVAAAILVAVTPFHAHTLNPGPMTIGHEKVDCTSCHIPSPGTARQQVQAKLAHWMRFRKTPASFGFLSPVSASCTNCHARPDDAHPLHRFNEPRFADAVREVGANTCLGCHREHTGTRVSSGGEFCSVCHDDFVLRNDPLDVSHRILVAEERWSSCLGCHDYHGNHAREVQTRIADTYATNIIRSYLAAGPSPYGADKRHSARSQGP